MMHTFPELVLDGVLVSPFVLYAGAALAIFAVLRPLLYLVSFERAFSNPPAAELSLYVAILALLIAVF
jgi:membrane associated rhomboid family serine protease